GGIGHMAVQLAKRMGAEVFAVASGSDGVELVQRLGADVAVDGHRDDVATAARAFAPKGLDLALVLASAPRLNEALEVVRKDGRIAYPKGVELGLQPIPEARQGTKILVYNGEPSARAFHTLNRLIGNSPFHVEISRVYRLEDAATAHRQLGEHHLGKNAFKVR